MRHNESGIAFSRRIRRRRKESLDPAHPRMAGRRVRKSVDPVFTEHPSNDAGEPSKVLRPLHAQMPLVSPPSPIPPHSRHSHGPMLPVPFASVAVENDGGNAKSVVKSFNELEWNISIIRPSY